MPSFYLAFLWLTPLNVIDDVTLFCILCALSLLALAPGKSSTCFCSQYPRVMKMTKVYGLAANGRAEQDNSTSKSHGISFLPGLGWFVIIGHSTDGIQASIMAAVDQALIELQAAGSTPGVICICGSLHIVADALNTLDLHG